MASLSYDQRATGVGFGCIAAFMVPFLAAGFAVIVVGLREYSRGAEMRQWLIPIVVGSAFTIFSIGFAAMPLYAMRRARADADALQHGVIVDREAASSVSLHGCVGGVVWRTIMKKVPLSEAKDDLSRYVQLAAHEEIVVTRHGRPAAVLIGFEDDDDWFEYQIEHDPRFIARMDSARRSLEAGRGIRIEDLRTELGLTGGVKPQARSEKRAVARQPGSLKKRSK
ncbi:MAG TPA: type II toxin-antitoxin system Phd/YefM family antitoxin [Thermoanaerobaculia bacterium]